jgi:hypothetical protein
MIEGGKDLSCRRVKRRVAGLLLADNVDRIERQCEVVGRLAVPGASHPHVRQRPVRHIERPDPLEPRLGPAFQLLVGICGADEIAADVRRAPQWVYSLDLGERLVDREEVRAHQEAPARLERAGLGLDTEMAS